MTKFNQSTGCGQQANTQFLSDKQRHLKANYEMNHMSLSQSAYSESLTNMLESKMNGLMSHHLEMIDDTSSVSSAASIDEHILAPRCIAGRNRPCLTWACKACKVWDWKKWNKIDGFEKCELDNWKEIIR